MKSKFLDYLIVFLIGVGSVEVFNLAAWAMNQPSSAAFYSGLLLIAALGFGLFIAVEKIIKSFKNK